MRSQICAGALLLFTVFSGCGTQTGNALRQPTLSQDISLQGSLLNFTMMDIADGLSTGDYAYRPQTSRLVAHDSCDGGKAHLVTSGAEHTVVDVLESGSAASKLRFNREVDDLWSDTGFSLDCQDDLLRGQLAAGESVSLTSKWVESKQRDLEVDLGSEVVSHFGLVEVTAVRRLSFLRSSPGIEATFSQRAQLRITTLADDGSEAVLEAEAIEAAPVSFEVRAGEAGEVSYVIPKGEFSYRVAETSRLTFQMKGVTYRQSSGCVPVSGTIEAELTSPGFVKRWELTVDGNQQLQAFEAGRGPDVVFAPFGCGLKER